MADDRDDEETESEEETDMVDEESEDEESDGEEKDSDDEGSDEEDSDDEDSDDEDSDDEDSDDEDSGDEDSDDEGSDDEDSDDEGSDDEDSDDEGSDDEDSDDEEEAAPEKARAGGKSGARTKKRKAAGARLAAARAAKAARKAAKRGKERQDEKAPLEAMSESQLGQKAAKAGDWAKNNRNTVYAIAAAIVLAIAGGIGWYEYRTSQNAEAGALLSAAVEISNATLRAEDAPEPEEGADPSFTSAEARAEAALEAYDVVLDGFGGSEAAAWAHVGRGRALLDLGRNEDARAAFASAEQAGGGDPVVVWRALEGRGFSHEADEEWAEAAEIYEQLGRIADARFEDVSKYHIARMYIVQGEEEQATETLNALVDSLREAADDEDEQEFAYVLAQAEIRLRELDPSAVPARPTLGGPGAGPGGPPGGSPLGGPPGAGGGIGDMTPEQIQELIRQFQQKQQGGGAPPAP